MQSDSSRHDPVDAQESPIERKHQPLRSAPGVAVALLLLHVIFEYLRLHQIWPELGELKVQTVIFAALLLIVISETGKRGVRLARQSWLLLGFLGLTVFAILPATNQYYAYRFVYSLTLILIGYFAITHFLQNERDLKRFLSLLVGIHIYLGLKVILGYNPRGFNPQGYQTDFTAGSSFLGDENDVALAMILILPLAFYLFGQARSLPKRVFWGVGSVLILFTIIFTFSRGGFLGLGAMTLYWVITSKNKVKAISAFVLAGALVMAVAPSEYWTRMETIKDTDQGTALERRNSWAGARRMFYDSPIWGVGGNNFAVLHSDYAIEYSEEKRPTRWGRVSHSMYFDLLAEFGLLGVLLIGSILWLNFRDLRRIISMSDSGYCSASMGMLAMSLRLSWVGFLVPAAFLSVLSYPHLYYLTALTVVARDLASADEGAVTIEPVTALEKVK